MRVGIVAPPWLPVPPVSYGGTEKVIDGLARGLAARGHEVQLFTIGDSTCPVRREAFFEHGATPMGATIEEAAQAIAAYEWLRDCDVIHDHTLAGPMLWVKTPPPVPVVVTNHGPFTASARAVFGAFAQHAAVVAISRDQAATAGDVPVAAVIHHGIDTETYRFGPGGGGYWLFVGRMSPDKGLHRAIAIARRAGKPLVATSKMWEPAERRYYDEQIRPLLGDDFTLLSDTTEQERVRLLRHAEAVVNPISWHEPFGLVMAEALACGTPVLAFPNGAAPEIIDDGVTGFLSDDEATLAAAPVHLIDRRACRRAAVRRFSIDRMTCEHEALYLRLCRSAPLNGHRAAIPTHRTSPF